MPLLLIQLQSELWVSKYYLLAKFCRLLYWTDTGTDRIEIASMDGTSRTVLHSTGLSTVYGLTIDYDNQILYWIDSDQIEKSSTDGSNRAVISSSGITNPFAITFYDGKLYWTDLSNDAIYTLTVTLPTVSQVIRINSDSYDIRIVTKERQPQGMAL